MVYVMLAEGFEEIEALTPVDILRRGGAEVRMVGVTGGTVTGSHGIAVTVDLTITEATGNPDMIILPGGMPGTNNLQSSPEVISMITAVHDAGHYVAAICAAPKILGEMGILAGREAICFPGFEKFLTGAEISKKSVVRDRNIITAKGAGVAAEFGFELLTALKNAETTETVRASMQYLPRG